MELIFKNPRDYPVQAIRHCYLMVVITKKELLKKRSSIIIEQIFRTHADVDTYECDCDTYELGYYTHTCYNHTLRVKITLGCD
jgi:hypothetical protein